ncbi:MAG TPA: hypothetical protein VKV74_02020 [Bryobacteraceae bacterium]|nr:hypothetical protein [Bryobacteraceae bacterium]
MKNQTAKRLLLNAVVLGIPLIASAQILAPEALAQSKAERVPLTADVTFTLSSNTPSGAYTQSQAGKYWRSRDGKTRQDTAFGSGIADPAAGTVTYLNHSTREATVVHLPPRPTPPSSGAAKPPAPAAHLGPGGATTDLGERQIAGHTTTGRRTLISGDPAARGSEESTEVWTAADLGLPLYVKHHDHSGESIQEYKNVQVGDPDPSVFAIPAGYKVTEKEGAAYATRQTVTAPPR